MRLPELTQARPERASGYTRARQALATAVVFLAGLAVAAPVSAQEIVDVPPTPPVRVVLLPMVVHSAEPPEYLREGLADMLSSRLERIEDFEVVRIDSRGAATTDPEKALEQAKAAGAEFVLFGSFTRFGTGASLDVQCAGVAARPGQRPLREIFVHSGSIGDVIPDLDDLIGKVARFVISDYRARVEDETGQPANLSTTRVERLTERVAALEKALDALNARLGEGEDADGELGEVAGTP